MSCCIPPPPHDPDPERYPPISPELWLGGIGMVATVLTILAIFLL